MTSQLEELKEITKTQDFVEDDEVKRIVRNHVSDPARLVKEEIKAKLDDDLIVFSNSIKKRLKDDWDIVMAWTGEEGSGKSTGAVMSGLLGDKNFDLVDNIAYLPNYEEVEGKFHNLQPQAFFNIDEATKVLYKLNWMNRLQVRINEMYQTERWQNKATQLCIPRIHDLNEHFRNHRVKVWIHIVARSTKMQLAHAVAFIRDDTDIFHVDPWHMRDNHKIITRAKLSQKLVEIPVENKIQFYEKSPNFFFTFSFPPLPQPIEEAYKELKEYYRIKSSSQKEDSDPRLQVVLDLYRREWPQKDIANACGLHQTTVSRWVEKHLKH